MHTKCLVPRLWSAAIICWVVRLPGCCLSYRFLITGLSESTSQEVVFFLPPKVHEEYSMSGPEDPQNIESVAVLKFHIKTQISGGVS